MLEEIIERAIGNPAVLASLIVLGVFYLAKYAWDNKPKKIQFPAPKLYEEKGNKDITQLHSMVKDDFQKHKNSFFRLGELHGDVIVLPTKYLEELKDLPETTISFEAEHDELFLSQYTHMTFRTGGGQPESAHNSVRNQLTRSLGTLMEDIYDEMLYAFKEEMPACDDWTEVNINEKLIRIVALVSGRIFIGRPMNHNEEYLDCIINFTRNCFASGPAMRQYPAWLRPLAQYWVPEVQAVRKSLATMMRLLGPIIEQNNEYLETGDAPRNINTWNMENSSEENRRNIKSLSHFQLALSMAAIHTTSTVATHGVFDIASRPEYFQPLRQESAEIRSKGSTPYLSKTDMPKLKLLDSFLKETQRINPLSIITMRRKVLKDVALHDGTLLPAGTHIAAPNAQTSQDPDLWENPENFDGFRFAKLREQAGQESKHQFVATGIDSLHWGHGFHACPGRFFANNEIKLIFAHLLENYDFKFPDGQQRPQNLFFPGGYAADPTKMILMKKRDILAV